MLIFRESSAKKKKISNSIDFKISEIPGNEKRERKSLEVNSELIIFDSDSFLTNHLNTFEATLSFIINKTTPPIKMTDF